MKITMAKYNALLIDGEWYVVENVFSKSAKETARDKLKRLILDNIPVSKTNENSQNTNN